MRQLPAPVLALIFSLPAHAQPAPHPDDTTASFVARWNAWAEQTDPDTRFQAELIAVNRAIVDELNRTDDSTGIWLQAAFNDPAAPGNQPVAARAAERIAPHTARLRELLKSPHATLRFPTEADLDRWNASAPARIADDEPARFQPVSHAELLHHGWVDEARLINVASILSDEATIAVHNGDTALAAANLHALIDTARLAGERPTGSDALRVVAINALLTDATSVLLHRRGRELSDQTLADLQAALLAHTPVTNRYDLTDLAHAELLAAWFDPDRPGRLTPRGRAWFESAGATGQHWRTDTRLRLDLALDPGADFAPPAEQIRVYRSIAAAFARDAAKQPHERDELESDRLFRTLRDADPDARLAPAMTLFYLHGTHFEIDLRTTLLRRAALTMLGVHRHRTRTGAWPETLAEVDPAVMRLDPIDPYTGQPFGYAVLDARPILWAAGPDRDDDDARPIPGGGAPPPWFSRPEWDALPAEVQAEYDGDVVLFPPAE